MMKRFFVGVVSVLLFVVVPSVVSAVGPATLELDQERYEVDQGERLRVVVQVSPNGTLLDTVRAVVTFDPSVLRAETPVLIGPFDRSAPGNYVNNTSGRISWAGFTVDGPVTDSVEFVELTFVGLSEGEANVAISSDSRMISNGEEMIDVGALDLSMVVVQEVVTDESLALVVVDSSTHPDEGGWYSQQEAAFSWVALEGTSAIGAYYYAFDQEPLTDPTRYLDADRSTVSVNASGDGVYYFHLKGVQVDGRETAVVHRRVNIDTQPPNEIALTANDTKLIEGERVWLNFATTDEHSGVLQYQIAINDSAFQVQQSPLEITDLEAGTYFFRVAALDRAGNTTYGGVSVRLYPEGTELDRPEGFDPDEEIVAIAEALGQPIPSESESTRIWFLLITSVGFVFLFGIIYVLKRRKK